jgi:predicted TIM-barrel fold metal-dependent hydrolase
MSKVMQMKSGHPTARQMLAGIKVIDADTHFSEPWDLWTSRAPAHLKDRVPRVTEVNGEPQWTIDKDTRLASKCGHSAVMRDGTKAPGFSFYGRTVHEAHEGASQVKARLQVMDEQGIYAQILYPNVLGFGGQLGKGVDEPLRVACMQIFNDAMAEMQTESGNRIFPMTMLPWWDVERAVAELERGAKMGLRGVNISSDTHDYPGLAPLHDPHWERLFQACIHHNMPVNFHIGGSDSAVSWFTTGSWPGFSPDVKLTMGGTMLIASNMRVLGNILMSQMLDKYPGLKIVSVESGVGWIPYLLEALEYMSVENGVQHKRPMKQIYREHIYACTFFEKDSLLATVKQLGADNILFETDFPHPACLYPSPLEYLADTIEQLTPAERFKIFSGNAAKLYNIDID